MGPLRSGKESEGERPRLLTLKTKHRYVINLISCASIFLYMMNLPKHLPLIDAFISQQETVAGLGHLESIRRKENKVNIFLDTGAEAELYLKILLKNFVV